MARGKVKTAAPEAALGELHLLMSMTLADQVRLYTEAVDPDTGEIRPLPVPPALLAQAINFLKNNGITALEPGEEGLGELKRTMGSVGNILKFPYKPQEADDGMDTPQHAEQA